MTELKIDGAANGVKTSSKKYPVYGQVTHPSLNKPFTILTTISQECFDSAVNFKPDSGDTFIVTYPKSGTTWLMNIIYLMQNNGMPVSKGECIDDIIPFLEFDGAEKAYNIPRPRVIKTHMYKAMVPFRDDVKYVLVVRNPKDVAVSYYYHTVGFDMYYDFADGKFDDFFEIFIAGDCDWGDYFKMVSEWYEESKTKKNIYMVLYEDMKNNTKSEILKLAEFLGENYYEKLLKNNEELLNKILENSSFSKMNKAQKTFCPEDRPDDRPFIRKGVIGDWKNLFSRDQSEQIDKRIAETDKKCPGFANLWSKYDHLLQF